MEYYRGRMEISEEFKELEEFKEEEILKADAMDDEEVEEITLRPKFLNEFIGQDRVKDNLKIYIESAKKRDTALDHVLFYGPPGLGKTTLSNIIANEMGSNIRITSGPAIERTGDLVAILSNLQEGDVLFIDEIHRMSKVIEEILYPVLEDYGLDIIIGKGPSARSIRLNLPKFTLVGATTKAGMLSTPLRDRFGIVDRLDTYSADELYTIIKRSADIVGATINNNAAREIAERSRGTPRIANRILRRVVDFATVLNDGQINLDVAQTALHKLGIDNLGLNETDRRLLNEIYHTYSKGPVGIDALVSYLDEEGDTIENVYEPYLMQVGFIARTPRGRIITPRGEEYLLGKK